MISHTRRRLFVNENQLLAKGRSIFIWVIRLHRGKLMRNTSFKHCKQQRGLRPINCATSSISPVLSLMSTSGRADHGWNEFYCEVTPAGLANHQALPTFRRYRRVWWVGAMIANKCHQCRIKLRHRHFAAVSRIALSGMSPNCRKSENFRKTTANVAFSLCSS